MTRSRALPRFKGRKPEELPDNLERLVEELEAELDAIRAQTPAAWAVSPTVLASAGPHELTWQTGYLVQTSAASVSVRLPYGRRANVGQRVAVVKLSASNGITVYAVGSQKVSGAASESLSAVGWREFVWCGDGASAGWRLVS